jgi:exonuclease VII large subunit
MLAALAARLAQLMRSHLRRSEVALVAATRSLDHLSPTRVLARGYSITTIEGGSSPIKDAASVRAGQVIETTLARGRLRSVVHRPRTARGPSRAPVPEQGSLFDTSGNGGDDDADR